MKTCTMCKKQKRKGSFYADSRKSDGYRSACKKCYTKRYPFQQTERGRETWRRYKASPKGIISCLLGNAKKRAEVGGRKYELSKEWLETKIKNGVCELSGIKFEWGVRGRYKAHPFAPSIDKINPQGDYVEENCRVVCFCVNMARSDWGDEILFKMAKAVVDFKAITWK